ncbi:MAG TPA: hypothetical protein VF437_11820 [Verrucomicrobiae bacterium]|jgi:hypothetical protein
MNPESENFDQLRRLLALKRHEAPPPRYFNDFSGQVISRIRANEKTVPTGISWLQRMWASLEAKPAMAGSFGVAVCALLVAGVLYSTKMDVPVASNNMTEAAVFPSMGGDSSTVAFNQPANQAALGYSTSPVMPMAQQSSGSLFDQFTIKTVPASFNFSGN